MLLHVPGEADVNSSRDNPHAAALGRARAGGLESLTDFVSSLTDAQLADLLRSGPDVPLRKMLAWSGHAKLHIHLFATAETGVLAERLSDVLPLLDPSTTREELMADVHVLDVAGNSRAIDVADKIAPVALAIINARPYEQGWKLIVARVGGAPGLAHGLMLGAAIAAAPDVTAYELRAPPCEPATHCPAPRVLRESTAAPVLRATAALLEAQRQPGPLAALLGRAIDRQPELDDQLGVASRLAHAAAELQLRPQGKRLQAALDGAASALRDSNAGASPPGWVAELRTRPRALDAAEALASLGRDDDLAVVLLYGLLCALQDPTDKEIEAALQHAGFRAARNRSRLLGDGPGLNPGELHERGRKAHRHLNGRDSDDPWRAVLTRAGIAPTTADPVEDLMGRAVRALQPPMLATVPGTGTVLVGVAGEATLVLDGAWLRDGCKKECPRQRLERCPLARSGNCGLDLRGWGERLLAQPPDPRTVRSPMLEAQVRALAGEIDRVGRFILLTTDQPDTTAEPLRRRDSVHTGQVLAQALPRLAEDHPLSPLRDVRLELEPLAVDIAANAALRDAVHEALTPYAAEIALAERVVLLDLGGAPAAREALLLELLVRRPRTSLSTFRLSRADDWNTSASANIVDAYDDLRRVRDAAQLRATLSSLLQANAPGLALLAAQTFPASSRAADLLGAAARLQSAPPEPGELRASLSHAAALTFESQPALATELTQLGDGSVQLARATLLLSEALADLVLRHAPRWRASLRLRALRAPLAAVIAARLTGEREPLLAVFAEALPGDGTIDAEWATACGYVGHSDVAKQRLAALGGQPAPATALAGLLDCAAAPCRNCPLRDRWRSDLPATGLSAWRVLRTTREGNRIAHAASAKDPTGSLAGRLGECRARHADRSVAEDLEAAILAMAPEIAARRSCGVDIVRDLGQAALAAVGGSDLDPPGDVS